MTAYRVEARREWHDYHLHHIRLRKDMFTSEVKVLTEEGIPEQTAANQINGLFERAGLRDRHPQLLALAAPGNREILHGS